MPIRFLTSTAICEGICTIEEAEMLQSWLKDRRSVLVDLGNADHVHTAIVQVILASPNAVISALPKNTLFRDVLATARVGPKNCPEPAMTTAAAGASAPATPIPSIDAEEPVALAAQS
ncbi:MAG: hypothetical protein AAGJ94_03980 [Pseudomonadota bacterium]